MKGRFECVCVWVLCGAIGWFYLWTERSREDPWDFGIEQDDYYNLLIDGYLDGQLNMKVAVPEALLKLPDPYDPAQRPVGLGLHDASFYKGKYYAYFGVAPAIVFMLPFRVVTGIDLPIALAILIFIYGGFVMSVATWLAIRRRYFPDTSALVVLAGVLVLGLAGVGPVLLRRPYMWELPIGGGYFFAMSALLCLWRSLHVERRRGWWFAGAGLCLGLAIASRPTYLFASPLLVAPLLWWWRSERRVPWRLALGVAAPLAVIGGLMAWHNHARFDDPLEFGQRYQLSFDYESKLPHFRAAYVPYNVRTYFFAGAEWTRYFPFIRRADVGEVPKGFTIHRGDVYGILIDFPVVWLALLAPLAWWRRPKEERGPIGAWIGATALLFGLTVGPLLFFFSALARYQMDFLPALMLLAGVGLLAFERWLQLGAGRAGRWIGRATWIAATVFSALFGALFSLQFDGLLAERNPWLAHEVARALNRIPAAIERVCGVRHGSVELTLQLPAGRRAGREALLTSGQAPRVDRVFVSTMDDGRVQFGIAPFGSMEQLSRPLSIDAGAVHRLRVTMGSLYPPTSHPFFNGRTPEEVRRIARELRVDLDDEPVLVGHQRARNVASNQVRIGTDAMDDAVYPHFHGSILAVRRGESEAGEKIRAHGDFVRLRLAFNAEPGRGCEPLISFGDVGSNVLLMAMRAGDRRVALTLMGGGSQSFANPCGEVTIEPGRVYELVVRVESGRDPKRRRVYLWFDGTLVSARETAWSVSVTSAVTAGKNTAGVSGCAPEFGGRIFQVQTDPRGRDPLVVTGDRLRMRVRLPSGRSGSRDPLVVTGQSGAGDMLMVEYADAQTVRFALDHWGAATEAGEPVRLDFAQPHEIEVVMTSLDAVEDATRERGEHYGHLRVTVDRAVVLERNQFFFFAEPAEIVVGRNPIGGTSCGPVFRGDVLLAERVVRE